MFKVLKIQIKNMNIMNLFSPLKKSMSQQQQKNKNQKNPQKRPDILTAWL